MENRRRESGDGRQKTEDRRREMGDGRQKTGDRMSETEDRDRRQKKGVFVFVFGIRTENDTAEPPCKTIVTARHKEVLCNFTML